MIWRCLSRDKTWKGGRIMSSALKTGFESFENVMPLLLDYVAEKGVVGSDGCGVCQSNKVQKTWIPLYSNHSKNEWVKYCNWRSNKDFQGGDQPTEFSFRRFRDWIKWKDGMTYKQLYDALTDFLLLDDFIKSYTNRQPTDVISTCLQELHLSKYPY